MSPEKDFYPPASNAFCSKQIDLFQSFTCASEEEQGRLSNTIPLWDCLPLYTMSRQRAGKLRKSGEFPLLLNLQCQYEGKRIRVEIQPARLLIENVVTEFYPGANEQLIEDALRKIATLQNYGYYDEALSRHGVRFTIYQLRKELKKQGHTRSYQEIVLSLKILARSAVEIRYEDQKTTIYDVCTYFSRLSSVSMEKLEEDPNAKWYVEFHPLIARAIGSINYRQFDYALMMSHDSQLTRWLHKYFVAKFTYAAIGMSFEIRFSTIKRDSGLLEGYGRKRSAIAAVNDSLIELTKNKVLGYSKPIIEDEVCFNSKNIPFFQRKIFGSNGEIEDVVYTVYPTKEFSLSVKKSNANNKKLKREY
jgi:hypothetical protein